MNPVREHVKRCVEAAKAENERNFEEAERIRAQAKLHMISMSQEELWELAGMPMMTLYCTQQQAFGNLLVEIERHKAEADEWLPLIERGN